LNGQGIQDATSGAWENHAASHATPKGKSLPVESGQGKTLFDEAFVLRNQNNGKPIGMRAYRIKRADGQYVYGVSDKDGHTRLSLAEAAQALKIEIAD